MDSRYWFQGKITQGTWLLTHFGSSENLTSFGHFDVFYVYTARHYAPITTAFHCDPYVMILNHSWYFANLAAVVWRTYCFKLAVKVSETFTNTSMSNHTTTLTRTSLIGIYSFINFKVLFSLPKSFYGLPNHTNIYSNWLTEHAIDCSSIGLNRLTI